MSTSITAKPTICSRASVLCLAGILAAGASFGAKVDLSKLPPPAKQQHVTYQKDIRPIFEASCVHCHSGKKPKGRLRLDSLADVLKGGKGGAVIIPGDSAHSKLVIAVARLNPKMAMPPIHKKGHGRHWGHGPGNRPPGGAGERREARPDHRRMMHPRKPLTAAQVGLIRAWIDQGAK